MGVRHEECRGLGRGHCRHKYPHDGGGGRAGSPRSSGGGGCLVLIVVGLLFGLGALGVALA
jgi:hypothetical protein